MGDDDMIRREDAKAAFACETAYGRGVRAKLSDVPAASSKLVKREEIQRNRDEAYQVGWGDGYAEGYGKALPAADARAEALKEAHKAILAMDTREEKDLQYNLAVLRAAGKVRDLIRALDDQREGGRDG